jgi:hypothetical protein
VPFVAILFYAPKKIMRNRTKFTIAISASILILAIALLLIWRGVGSPSLEPGQVFFVELVYEQDFRPITETAVSPRAYPELLNGYIFRPKESRLYSCRGTPLSKDAQFIVGRRLHFLHDAHDSKFQMLGAEQEGFNSWPTADEPTARGIADFVDPYSLVRLSAKLTASMDGKKCLVTSENRSVALNPNESKLVWEGTRELSMDEYFAQLRSLASDMLEIRDSDIESSRAILNINSNNRLTIHARVTAIFHGPVKLSPLDYLTLRKQAFQSAREGRFADAVNAFGQYLEAVPTDSGAEATFQVASYSLKNGVKLICLRGNVLFPKDASNTYTPAKVAVRMESDPEGQYRTVATTKDDKYELFLPAGRYQLNISVRGFNTLTRFVDLKEPGEVNIEFNEADRRY